MKVLNRYLTLGLVMITTLSGFGQKRQLEQASKAIGQGKYVDAQEDLRTFLTKNDNVQSNAFLLLSARCYGDLASPFYRPDTAYAIVSSVQYYPSTFKLKSDEAVCGSYQACLDTVQLRKTQYIKGIFQIAIQKKDIELLKYHLIQFTNKSEEGKKAESLLFELEYTKISNENSISSHQYFIAEYPEAPQLEQAKSNLEKLEFERALSINSLENFEEFNQNYPNSKFKDSVNNRIEIIYWNIAKKANQISSYREFQARYPESIRNTEGLKQIEQLQWLQIASVNEGAYYRWFMRTYPHSEYLTEATHKMCQEDWNSLSSSDNEDDLQRFIEVCKNTPEGELAIEALSKLTAPYNNSNR